MKKPPKPCRQKQDGRPDQVFVSYTTDDNKRKRKYFGAYGDPAAMKAAYDFIAALNKSPDAALAGTRLPAAKLNVGDLCERYLTENRTLLSPRRWGKIKQVILNHLKSFLCLPIDEFDATRLLEFRNNLDNSKQYCKATVGDYIAIVRQIFRWGRENRLVSKETLADLTEIRTRSTSHVNEPRAAVPREDYEKTLPFLPSPYREITQLLYLTGARPSEILNMRVDEIDRSKDTWRYRPTHHKNESKGKTRDIALGAPARAIITDWLNAHPGRSGYLFQRIDTARGIGKRPIAEELLYRTIKAAATKAGVAHWVPYQLRHLAATEIQEQFGIDCARSVLGHTNIAMTQNYAHGDFTIASRIAESRG